MLKMCYIKHAVFKGQFISLQVVQLKTKLLNDES